ncbi:hypothetical protein GALMADRAFT_246684 [Galerina marginata CBS 339.88]|uniref:Uncharacterized protein n=1 Tax=Galerina marginata (strain CBS 339.88) TaxID=685588 RepID=A0A067T4P8_GALM3|nr:hypothetical protein GALMADRAFT_246684 [Galerina marginata CBS 339.88]
MVQLSSCELLGFPLTIFQRSIGNGKLFGVQESHSAAGVDPLPTEWFTPKSRIGTEDGKVYRITDDPDVNSLLSTYSRTRSTPRTIDIALLKDFVEECSDDIADHMAKIEEIKSSIYDSCSEIATLCCYIIEKEAEIEAARSVCAPIRSIPPEILDVIFKFCLPAGVTKLDVHMAPMVLCQVCKTWRDVVIRNPSLWNSIFFDIPNAADDRTVSKWRNLSTMISERTTGTLTSLEIRDHTSSLWSTVHQQTHLQLLQSLSLSFSNCRKLTLKFQASEWGNTLSKFTPTGTIFSNLDELAISLGSSISRAHTTWPQTVKLFENLPKLCGLSVDLPDSWRSFYLVLPYQQLTSLNYPLFLGEPHDIGSAVSHWAVLLRRCKNLRNLAVIGKHPRRFHSCLTQTPASELITLQHVNHLSITTQLRGNVDIILQSLHLPALVCLQFIAHPLRPICEIVCDTTKAPSLDLEGQYTCFTMPSFSPHLSSLTELCLIRVFIHDEDFIPLFGSTPCLRRLTLRNFKPVPNDRMIMDDRKFLELLSTTSCGSFLPNLSYLKLYYCGSHLGDGIECYTSMVKARIEMNSMVDVRSQESGSHFDFMLFFLRNGGRQVASSMVEAMAKLNIERRRLTFMHEVVGTYDGI